MAPRPGVHSVPLTQVLDRDRPEPVFSIADGILADPMLLALADDRRKEYDRLWVAAYQGDTKVTLDVERDEFHAYRIDEDPGETTDVSAGGATLPPELTEAARDVGRRMQGAHAPSFSDETEARLRAWGYL